MARLDGEGVRVVLLGTGSHASGSRLPDVPAVESTVRALRSCLVEVCGLREQNLLELVDPEGPEPLLDVIIDAAGAASDLLLVYYVGHGVLDVAGQLHLATKATVDLATKASFQALAYSEVIGALQNCRARRVLVILDCCYSGRASTPVRSGALLASADRDEHALAPVGEEFTAFSGELVRALREGIPTAPAQITLERLHDHLSRAMRRQGRPMPVLQTGNLAGELVLAGNRADHSVDTEESQTPWEGRCPYRGLEPFTAADEDLFYGRAELVGHVLSRLGERVRTGGLTLVAGPSGSGKTSLLSAGILPAIAHGDLGVSGSSGWPQISLTPGEDPHGGLAAALTEVNPAEAGASGLTAGEARAAVRRAVEGVMPPGLEGADTRLVIVVDQFEELFSPGILDVTRRAFIETLHAVASFGEGECPPALVILGLRSDFHGQCVRFPELAAALEDNHIVVGPMTTAELRLAIAKPARQVGLALQPGLVDLLLRDTGADPQQDQSADYDPGTLPLLAHALLGTCQHRRGTLLSVEGYREIGGVAGAISTTAENTFTSLDTAQQDAARRLLLRMIRVGEDIPDTRRRMNPHELLAGSAARSDTEAALEAFANARLITKDNDTAQITHEALIRSWPRLRDWMNTDREDRLLAQEVETNSTEWQRDNRDADRLYRGNQLTRARTLDDGPRHGDLSDTAREFLRASIERERAEQQGLLRRTRRLRQLVAVLSCLVLIAATMAAIAVLSRNELAALHDESVSREVAGVADALRGSDPDLAAQLALAAYQIADTAEARGALITALGNLDPERRSYSGSNDAVQAVAFSHDGQSLVAASRDKFARVWAVGNPPSLAAPPIAFLEHPGQVRSAVFDPTDRFLITSGSDGFIRIWPAADFGRNTEPIRPLPGPTGARGPLAFSPDGLILATGGPSGPTIQLWDVSDLTNPRMDVEFDAHQGEVGTVALSKDGRTLATGSDGTTKLWDITHRASPIELTKFDRHAGTAVAFSPDGHLLVIGNGDGSVMLVDVADPRQPREMPPFPAHQTGVAGVAFSPDSATLATASVDTTARLWNVSDPARPKLTATLDGDADNVYSVAFQPNGHTLATSSYGGTVRLWETDVKQAATEVCELAFPDITRTQWERYLPAGYEYKPPCLGPPGANRRRADVSTPPGSTSLVAVHSHKCVAIKGQVTAPGTPASQITCIRAHGARTQGAQWFLQRTDSPRPGGVVYHIRNTATGMCLDSLPSERRVGGASEVVQRPCVAASLSQSWKFEVTSQHADLTDGRFVNIEHTECLNVNYAAVNDDAPIIRWQCGNDLNGIFQVSTGAR